MKRYSLKIFRDLGRHERTEIKVTHIHTLNTEIMKYRISRKSSGRSDRGIVYAVFIFLPTVPEVALAHITTIIAFVYFILYQTKSCLFENVKMRIGLCDGQVWG